MARVTLKMIAERAGTSIGTVDRALNNREGVKEDSKRLILKVAEELGYRPNKLASALGRKKIIRIGIAYPRQPHEFYRDIDLGIDKAAEELQDYGVIIEKIRYETQEPHVAYERLAQIDPAAYDGLAINAAGAVNIGQIDHFVRRGLSVITFNNDATESERLFYIGNNSRQSGRMGGEILSMLLGGRGDVAVLGNFARTSSFIERFGGFCEFIQAHSPEMHIFTCPYCSTESEVVEESLLDVLARAPEIKGVFCIGYSSTVSAVSALKALNRQDIQLVGYDVTERTSEALREGWCRALLYQDPYRQGHQAAHLLTRHILEGWMPPKPRLHVDTRVIIKSNIDSYLNDSDQLLELNLAK